MFNGIIKKTAVIKNLIHSTNGLQIGIKTNLKLLKKDVGSSINCSGVCLTLEKISKGLFFFLI